MIRKLLHRYLPAQYSDPVGLFRRLVRSGNPAATFAVRASAVGLMLSPLDMLLSVQERRLYARSGPPSRPILVVCGPPRSGTTVVAQTLLRHLPVAYINNLTSLFPRSPIVANRLFGPWLGHAVPGLNSYYGRTTGYSGPNDALYIWDRWLGSDRDELTTSLTQAQKDNMRRFFGAFEEFSGQPILVKNNSLNTCAAVVAELLDSAFFLCLERDPPFLAQSLLKARSDIHGDDGVPYGASAGPDAPGTTPVQSVCAQVLFHREISRQQRARIGSERFWIVGYEEFCSDPAALVHRVSEKILGSSLTPTPQIEPLTSANRVRIAAQRFREIQDTLAELGVGGGGRTEIPGR